MTPLEKTQKKRQEIIEAAAAHLIDHGLHTSGLRAMGASIGMSDRMLMYYFETKEALVSEALLLIADGLAASAEASLPKGNASTRQVLEALTANLNVPQVQAVMRLWFEIIGLAMRGQEPYRSTAETILRQSEDQIRARLRTDQKHRAREVLSTLEGTLMVRLLQSTD
ncbi:MAG: TetR/AcrR family transcriptional regulator [Pseudomonadota bacterium]